MKVDIKNLGYFLSRAMLKTGKNNYHQIYKKKEFIEGISEEIIQSLEKKDNIKTTIENIVNKLNSISSGNPSTLQKLSNFGSYLSEIIYNEEGIKVLFAICNVCAPIVNSAVDRIPLHNVVKIAKNAAIKKLTEVGDSEIEHLITNWDAFTYGPCLSEDNNLATEILKTLPEKLKLCRYDLNNEVITHLIAGSLQEYERRAGQKRKTRAGADLQQAVEVILEFLKVRLDPNPKLVTGILEADHVIKHGDHYCIVSCKRTGRERVKQVAVEEAELIRLRIRKIICFFTEFDQSPSRIVDLGIRGSVFYLPDSSADYKKYAADTSTAPYIFPLSTIRQSLPKLVDGSIKTNVGY